MKSINYCYWIWSQTRLEMHVEKHRRDTLEELCTPVVKVSWLSDTHTLRHIVQGNQTSQSGNEGGSIDLN